MMDKSHADHVRPLAPVILVSRRSLKGIHGKDRQTMIEAA